MIWWKVLGLVSATIYLLFAGVRWIVRGFLRCFFGPWFVLVLGCAHGVEGPPPPPVDAGDACADCWTWCGAKERSANEVIICAGHTCPEVCS